MAGIHRVQQGEHLSGIAKAYGFRSWRTIYDHPKNAEFRKRRSNPEVILPGDEIFIPAIQTQEYSKATDQRHSFVLKRPDILFKLTLKDAGGKPIAGEHYTLIVGAHTYEGQTDGAGSLEQEISAHEQKGHLILSRLGLHYEIKIGHLDPVQHDDDRKAVISGAQARLNNLAFPCGQVDGVMGPRTRAALRIFQIHAMGRESRQASGECDGETCDALKREFGC